MSDLTYFPKFTKLPKELRHKIWKLTLPMRLIEFVKDDEYRYYKCGMTVPSALRTYSDSRTAVTKLYPYSFSSPFKQATIRFNFSLDTLFLSGSSITLLSLDMLKDHEVSQIRNIAVDEMLGYDKNYDTHAEVWKALERAVPVFRNLTKLEVVLMPRVRSTEQENTSLMMELHDQVPWQAKLLPYFQGIPRKFEPVLNWKFPQVKISLAWGWRHG